MRLTTKRYGKNVIPLLMAVCGIDLPYWRVDRTDDLHSYLSGDAADKLAAYEDTELTPEAVKSLRESLIGAISAEIAEEQGYVEVNRAKEIASAEAEGRLVVLPCKVGDRVYLLWSCGKNGKSVSDLVVKHIDIDLMPDIEFACRKEKGTGSYWFFKPNDIGKTVFLTHEEAEAALKGETEAEAIPRKCECCIGCEIEKKNGGCDTGFVLSPERAKAYIEENIDWWRKFRALMEAVGTPIPEPPKED